ncbi:MAG: hypothetical protein ACREDS_16115, partial [Limisphaerales bacterium]
YKPLERQFSRHSGLSWDNDGPDNYFFASIFIWRGGCWKGRTFMASADCCLHRKLQKDKEHSWLCHF